MISFEKYVLAKWLPKILTCMQTFPTVLFFYVGRIMKNGKKEGPHWKYFIKNI